MAYLTWLAAVLRAADLDVREEPGWRTRGRGSMGEIRGVLLHHTAGPATGPYPSLGVVRDGRPGLPGPLAQLGLARDGTWYVIAAGVANHAGLGYVSWCGRDNGNQHLIGVEAESTGRGDWTAAQLAAYPRGVAALLRYLRLPVSRAIAHKEWAPNRKIDPAGWPGDMTGFRAAVANPTAGGSDVSYDDAYRAIKDVLAEEFANPANPERNTSLRTQIAHGDYRADYVTASLSGQLAGVTEALRQLTAHEEVDLAAIEGAARRGVLTALETGVVRVDIDVAGGGQ